MSNNDKVSKEIAAATAEFTSKGGKIEEVETAAKVEKKSSRRERLAELKVTKAKMAEEEKAIREELDAGKAERKTARQLVNTTKEAFEVSRKECGDASKVVNGIHLTKSVMKHFDEFNDAIANWLLKKDNMETAAKAYLAAIREYKEL